MRLLLVDFGGDEIKVRLSGIGTAGFVEVVLFIGVLAFGLAYAWRKGALSWA